MIHLDFYNFPVELDLTKGPHKNPVKRSNGAGASGPKFHPLQLNMPKMPERYPLGICYQSESGSALENELHRAINKTVAAAIGVRLEGNYCHFHHSEVSEFTPTDPRRSWKREYLRHAVKDRRRALEVGFNAGHSAALMLAVNPLLSVHAIDICRHAYTEPCAALLGKKFGTRFGFGKGDSKSVLAQLDLKQFDFVHIGGGHDARTAKSDVDLFCARATVGTLLLVDDAYVPNISSMLHEKFTAGQLVPTVRGFPSSGENLLFVKTG